MCTHNPQTEETNGHADAQSNSVPTKATAVLAYLEQRVRTEGEIYVKSRFIAEEIELSSKEIGAQMKKLQEEDIGISVEKWGYTNGTTWRVIPP